MKSWMKAGLAAVGLVVVAVVAVSLLVNANTFRPLLESKLTAALGRPVKVGSLSLSLFSGSLVADDLSIADDPKFSTTPFLTAKVLKVGVEMRPLIFDKKVEVRSFEVDSPNIHLVGGPNGVWNFSSLSQGGAKNGGQRPQDLSSFSVGVITIKDGRATVERLPGTAQVQGQPRVYEHLNLELNDFSLVKAFPLTLSASLPAGGTVNMAGTAGPINQQDAAMTAADVKLSIKHMDPVAAGFVDASAGISMLADVEAHAVSNGTTITSDGSVHAERLVILKGGSAAPKPVDLSYNTSYSLKDGRGLLTDLAIKTGAVAAHVSGGYDLSGTDPVLGLKMVGKALPIDDLQALLPAAGVRLPNGSVLRGGTLTTTLAISGPIKDSVIAGPVQLDDTHLAGFNLGSKLSGITTLGGVKTGDTTSIQTLRMNVRVTNAGVQTDNLYASLPALGEASGSGTVASGGALDFRLTVKPTTTQGIGQVGVSLLSALNGAAGSTAAAAAKNGVPMTITGTTSNPVITADMKGLLRNNASGLLGAGSQILGKGQKGSAVDALTSLFGGKRK